MDPQKLWWQWFGFEAKAIKYLLRRKRDAVTKIISDCLNQHGMDNRTLLLSVRSVAVIFERFFFCASSGEIWSA